MKKSISVLIALICAIGLIGIGFAQAETAKASLATAQAQVIKGKIVKIENDQVTIKEANGVERTVSVAASEIASLKKDQEVKVTLKSDSNVATHVKIVSEHRKVNKLKQ